MEIIYFSHLSVISRKEFVHNSSQVITRCFSQSINSRLDQFETIGYYVSRRIESRRNWTSFEFTPRHGVLDVECRGASLLWNENHGPREVSSRRDA